MKFFTADRVKMQKRLIALNLSCFAVNLLVVALNFSTANMWWIVNVTAGLANLHMAYKDYLRLPVIKAEQEQAIMDYLRGNPV